MVYQPAVAALLFTVLELIPKELIRTDHTNLRLIPVIPLALKREFTDFAREMTGTRVTRWVRMERGRTKPSACRTPAVAALFLSLTVFLAIPAVFHADAARAEASCRTQVVAPEDAYIQNIPKSGPYKLYVFGDSLGDGAWAGLARRFKGDETVNVFRKTKVNSGIVRADRYDWNRAILQIARENFHIAVMMFGANDLQSIRVPGRRYHFNTEGWREQFKDRIDRLIAPLKRKKIAIYWIGLPVVSKPNYTRDYRIVNAIFREKMEEHGIKFIDVFALFASKSGTFVRHGTDVNGKMTVLRHKDGVHFSIPGNVKLASYVEQHIRSDIAAVTPCPNKAENQN